MWPDYPPPSPWGQRLWEVYLRKVRLREVLLREVRLWEVRLQEVRLRGVLLWEVRLREMRLWEEEGRRWEEEYLRAEEYLRTEKRLWAERLQEQHLRMECLRPRVEYLRLRVECRRLGMKLLRKDERLRKEERMREECLQTYERRRMGEQQPQQTQSLGSLILIEPVGFPWNNHWGYGTIWGPDYQRTSVDSPRNHKFDDPRYWRMIEGVARYSEEWEIRKAQKLDSWLRNMTRLSGLIDLLENLASSAAPERRPGINKQVQVLRSSLKKQQERYIEFLQLSRDYANKFLLDISSTIIGQEEFLDTLEKRLDMAKELHTQAIRLRKSYENEIAGPVEDIRKTVLSEPLPPDTGTVDEVDSVLEEIRHCHTAMNEFWLDEAQRANKALKTSRIGDDDIARWKGFRASLDQTIASSKDIRSKGNSEHQSLTDLSLNVTRPPNISAIVPDLLFAVHLAFNALSRMRLCGSIEALRGSLQGMAIRKILHVQSKFQGNIEACIAFFWRCAEYGDVVTTCGSVAVSKLVSPHLKDLQGLRDRMEQLRHEVFSAPPAALDAAHDDSVISAGTRKFSLVYAKSISLLRKLDSELCTLLDTAASWMAALDAVDAAPSGLTLAQLKKLKRVRSERKGALDKALEAVSGDQAKDTARGGGLPGFLRSILARGIRRVVIH